MRKLTQGLLVTITVAALGWSILSTMYTHTVSEELAALKRESHSDVIYLRSRLREVEKELLNTLLDRVVTPAEPVGGVPTESETSVTITETETDTAASDAESAPAESGEAATETVTESITLPTHQSPETRPVEGDAGLTAVYTLGVHEGRIGLFDAAGELLETINVFVMTLPDADRAALEVGIPVSSPEEARALMEKYE